ncbi:uncharacterized protein LOC101848621, partial [Aplysia californica]|uniref:Uncharacterized protein LOC101848621 n=1 Tax=Aplysia californica TaxID=6500 RepID=A0ABM0K7W5_APLCA
MNSFRVCKRCRCLRGASDSCCSQHSSTTATTTTTTTTTTATTTTTTTKSRVTSNCGSRGEHVEGTRATHVLDPHPDPDLNLGRPSVITKKKNDAGRISRSNNITVVMSESRGRPVHHHKRPDRLGGGGKTRREAKGGDNNERSSATAAAAAALVVPGGAKEAACNSAEERELSDTVFQSPLSSSTPAGRAEVTTKYGRAYSQPEDPGQLRLEKMRLEMGGESEESHDVGGGGMIRRHTHTTGTKRRNRSLYGVSPHCKFGPKGYLNSTSACSLTIPDPS